MTTNIFPLRFCGRRRAVASRFDCSGVGLIELMVAVAIGLMLMSAVTAVYVNTTQTRNEIEKSSRQIENGRYVVDVISNDLQLAGFLSNLGVNASIVPTPTAAAATICADTKDVLALHVQGVNQVAGDPACISGVKTNTDLLVIRRASTCATTDSGCDAKATGATRTYIQAASCKDDTVPYKVGGGGEAFVLRKLNCATLADIRELLTHIYYVSTGNALVRAAFSGATLIDTVTISENIENLQVVYGIDSDGNGSADVYKDVAASPDEWRRVTTVRFGVLASNAEKSSGFTQTRSYSLVGTDVGSFADGVKRHAYNTTVRLNNVAGRLE